MNTSLVRTASLLIGTRRTAVRSHGGLSASRYLRAATLLFMILFLTVGLTVGVMRVADEYNDEVVKAQDTARSAVTTLEAFTARRLGEAIFITAGIGDVLQAEPGKVNRAYISRIIAEKLRDIPQVCAFLVVGPHGDTITSGEQFSFSHGINAFAEHPGLIPPENTGRFFFVGRPLRDIDRNQPQRYFLPVGVRLTSDSNETAGYVIALIDVNVFGDSFRTVDIGQHGRVTLWTADGTLVAERGGVERTPGTTSPALGETFTAQIEREPRGAILITASSADRTHAVTAVERVQMLPLFFTVSLDERDYLRAWRGTRNRLIISAVGAVLAVIAIVGIILSQLQRARMNEEELRTAKAVAEEANEAKSRFLAHMSHEFRTPLNAIMGFSDVIQTKAMGEPLAPIYATYAGHIYRSGEHLLEIVNDILDMAKIESGIQSLDLQPINIATVINGAVSFLERMATAFHLSVKVAIGPHLHRVLGDERFVRQVLINLVSNAIKFSPPGRAVVVSAVTTDNGGIDLSVIDHGHGIEPIILKRIGEPFLQGNPALSRAGQGTGLGLSICKHYMDLLGGELLIDSAIGVGTTVIMRFPPALRVADDAESTAG